MSNYMPSGHASFITWADNFSTVLTANPAAYGLAAADAAAVAASVALADAAFALVGTAKIPGTARTPDNIAANDAQQRATKALMRPFAVAISSNTGIADALKVTIGVTVRATTHTPVPPATSQCLITPKATTPGQILVGLADENTPTKKARPYGMIGAELHTVAATVAPVSADVIPFTELATKARNIITTDAGDKGKQLYMAARWVNRRGEPGPFGPVVSAVIG